VISLAKKYFDTGQYPRLKLLCTDAADYLLENTEIFDLVIVDVYIDHDVPASCETEEFVKGLKKPCQKTGYWFLTNWYTTMPQTLSARKLVEKFEKTFGNIRLINISETWQNRMIVVDRSQTFPLKNNRCKQKLLTFTMKNSCLTSMNTP